MKSPQQIVGEIVGWIVFALIVALVLYFTAGWVLDAIRAPVVVQLDTAVKANDSLKVDNERLVAENTRLDRLLMRRSTFESNIDKRLKRVEGKLSDLKKSDPKVREWAETTIPPAVLQ